MPTSALNWRSRYDQWFASPQTVVVQPTTWCNLDCNYCYLPLRKLKHQMRPEVATALATSIAQLSRSGGPPIGIVWHGGEPFTVGPRTFTELLTPFENLRRTGRIHHYIQTNGTLITDTWCDLLSDFEIRVGVSIDGPASVNTDRVDLHGKLAFDRILRGIRRLREHRIPFSVISVVSTASITRAEELLEFLTQLGCHSAGFNLEEAEGVNTERQAPTFEQAEAFWRRTLAWTRSQGGALKVRELERLAEYLHLIRTGQRTEWNQRRLDPIPTVSVDGDVVLLSPELADTADAAYDDFHAGNVLHQPLADILTGAHRLTYVRDFLTGLENCRAECTLFDFCRGAQAANRYFENGNLSTTETNYCRVSRQALITALSTLVATEKKTAA